jgi:ABC-type Zn uptake system ZnuABC Zn-binding protein ZnuA
MILKTNNALTAMFLLLITVLPGCSRTESPRDDGKSTDPSNQTEESTVADHADADRSTGGRIPVIATYSILGDWVGRIGGEHVRLTTLVGPGGDAHTYEPTPQDSAAVADAKVLFENGLGFEGWLDRLYRASDSRATRVTVTEGIQGRMLYDSHGHSETDPHVWHDPQFAIEMVQSIAAALIKADPAHADDYQKNADAYVSELQELNTWIQGQITSLPESRRKLVTTHDTFGYFAERFGFQVSSVMGTVSSEVADPSAAQIAAIIETIRREEVPAIFAENILNPQLTEQVAREAGVRIVPTLFTDALGEKGSDGESYVQMMRSNVTKIVESLK